MLDEIREKKTGLTTYILVGMAGVGMLFIGVPFFSADQGISVAEVNGQDISYYQFQQAVGNIRSNNPDIPLAEVEQEAIRQLINQTLLNEHAIDSGFRYPDSALYQLLKSQFTNEEEYQRYLSGIGLDAAGYERRLQNDMTMRQYYNILANAQKTWPVVTDTLTANITQNRSFSIVRLPLSAAITDVTVDENDIESYYKAHEAELMRPPEVAVEYVLFDLNDIVDPSAITDAALTEARSKMTQETEKRDGTYLIFDQESAATQAHQQLLEGEEVDTIIAAIEHDGQGESGQFDLHAKGEGISPIADDALFALNKSGDISPVLTTDYGYMIVVAGHIEQNDLPDDDTLRQELAEETAQTHYHEITNKAFDAAQDGANIEQIASMLNSSVQKTTLFNKNNPPEQWINSPDVLQQLFSEEDPIAAGHMAQPVALDDNHSVFFAVSQRQAETLPPLEDIYDEVRTLTTRTKVESILDEQAKLLSEQWTDSEPPATLMTEYHAELTRYSDLNYGQAVDGLAEETLSELFSQASRTDILTAPNGDRLISRLDAVSNSDLDPQLSALLGTQWQQQMRVFSYQGMVRWLAEKAKIRITYHPE